mmetsp:Transcript_26823/g.70438  ORF Transcript_26823/g.70438 Transcript_26823/m.70438 type:complete len:210 (+) Transcript_26823:365-994(+)
MARNGAHPVPGPTMMSGTSHGGTLKVPAPAHTLSRVPPPGCSPINHDVHTPTRGAAIRVEYCTIATVSSVTPGLAISADEIENARGCSGRNRSNKYSNLRPACADGKSRRASTEVRRTRFAYASRSSWPSAEQSSWSRSASRASSAKVARSSKKYRRGTAWMSRYSVSTAVTERGTAIPSPSVKKLGTVGPPAAGLACTINRSSPESPK